MNPSPTKTLWRMQPDNFTPPSRTPWGGRTIVDDLKRELDLSAEAAAFAVVGESWEVSVEPSFPSVVTNVDGQPLLADLIAAQPSATLGTGVEEAFGGCPLLVKFLNASQPLSVQVHPDDRFVGLEPHQSGKPESWVIIAADSGAGIYLGLRDGVSREAFEAAIREGDDLSAYLNFVPVSSGDCFQIEAGTVHSIGPGITLVEPQIVLPGREGVTYRVWDWNRRYDESGKPHPKGQGRRLDVDKSMAVIQFDGLRGDAFVASTRRQATIVTESARARHERLIDSTSLVVERLVGTGYVFIETQQLLAITVIEGSITPLNRPVRDRFCRGESFVIPAAAAPVELALERCTAVAARPGNVKMPG